MEFEDDEILQGFIEESLEHLADIENDLLAIEDAGADIDENLVNKVFRAAHSIKGGAGFMGLTAIQELSHATENVLGLIRSKKLIPQPEIINVLLLASDQLEKMIKDINNSNEFDIISHIEPLNAIAEGTFTSSATSADKTELPTTVAETESASEESDIAQAVEDDQEVPGQTKISSKQHHKESTTSQTETSAEPEDAGTNDIIIHEQPVNDTPPAKITSKTENSSSSTAVSKGETSIRVNVSLLDSLMTLAGELVLSRNQLLQTIGSDDIRNAETVGQRIDLITSELQEAIMLTRMQPIGNVFNKFPRVVRDLAKQLSKEVDLTLVGKDVELDKTIIEAINDPLTHLVRNSIDHGIESPEARKAAGKSENGLVVLKAFHAAGQVVIEISDDGKGIDGEALAESAVKKGLLTVEQTKVMSDKEKVNLIFLPGFSMAKEVTDVSGRGVGMDVVKTNLDQLGGHVDIISEIGHGTTISIKLPLTLAIIPCQIIMTGGERYAIPQVNLEELLRIPARQVKERVERVGDAEVVRLRGHLLPLIRLSDVIGLPPTYWDDKEQKFKVDRRQRMADRRGRTSPLFEGADDSAEQTAAVQNEKRTRSVIDRRQSAASALNIVVVSTGSMKYGLVVDRLLDSEEIVIKPLGRHLQQCKGYAGATIMGDGRIALILDVSNLARMANLTSLDGTDRAAELAISAEDAIKAQKDKQALLIFRSSENEQFAAPLNQVERIEKIKTKDIEELGGRRVMQYRGGSLSLVRVDDVATVQPLADHEDLLVIVFKVAGRNVGLLAIGPIDAIEVTVEVDDVTLSQQGIMGSAIIDSQTTMLVNIFELVEALFPEWIDYAKRTGGEGEQQPATILLAEDSNFFRNQVKGYLIEAGYEVIEAEDGQIAWELMQNHGPELAMVLTDIEMPNKDGFQLTIDIRNDTRFKAMPVFALTTLAGEEDVARGKAVGIDEYHIKLDKERLMNSVHNALQLRN